VKRVGRDIAWGLAEQGYRVFATALSEAKVQDLKNGSRSRPLDLCDITRRQEAAV